MKTGATPPTHSGRGARRSAISRRSSATERRPVIGDIRLGERPDRPRATRLSLLDDMTREAAAARDHGDGAHDLGGKVDLEQPRSEEHTSELQSLMRISYAVC